MQTQYQTIHIELSAMSEATYSINLRTAISALQRGPLALAFPIIFLTRPDDPRVAELTEVVKNTMNQMVDDLSVYGTLCERPSQEGQYVLLFFAPRA